MTQKRLVVSLLGATLALVAPTALILRGASGPAGKPAERKTYHSPLDVAFSPDGKMLAVSDHTAGEVVLIGRAGGQESRGGWP